MKSLVIVESPTKIKTLKKYLPKDYVIDSSMGHIRDLPASAKEIPSKFKKEEWANLGVNTDEDFDPLYVIPSGKKKVVKKLKKLLKDADELVLATDEDREGEAISWHLVEILNPDVPVKRMVFREITKEAIQDALKNFRDIDMNLVNAQETRRIIDRLAGYTISPLLWKKIAPGLSAGRVQSVAVRFLVERERERMKFRSARYWDLKAQLSKLDDSDIFEADLTHLDGKRLASGKDFDENTGKLKKPKSVVLLDDKKASDLRDDLDEADWKVSEVKKNRQKRNPAPAFITSTLQQEANRKFGYSAKRTMQIAQKLYENGLITYMRTDSARLSGQAINAARNAVEDEYGKDYLFKRARNYGGGSKGAQEAHEAIRPAGSSFTKPEKAGLSGPDFKLYDLIWKRTIATQMAQAELEFTNVVIEATANGTKAEFKTSGKKILFPGFFRAYVEGSDDPEAALENQENYLPELTEGEGIEEHGIEPISHETKPPSRFTEATLVKELEKRGIGRPSTYASIISTVQDRGYVETDGKTLIPTFTAFAVTELLERNFPDLVDSDFTSEMEDKLDKIAQGEGDPKEYLSGYYKGKDGLKAKVESREDKIDPQEARQLHLPLKDLDNIDVLVGRYGPYIKSKRNGDEVTTSIPNQWYPSDITVEKLEELVKAEEQGPKSIGDHPETGEPIFVLNGRYGPYVQVGEVTDDNKKPDRASLLKGMKPEDVDLDLALQLLDLPRLLGKHPETGKDVRAGVGRYGPFVVHDGTFASLRKNDHVLEVDLDRALELLAQKKKPKRSNEIKSLGEHPSNGKKVRVMTGRYGPYIKYGKKNISLPDDVDPEEVSMDDAVKLIAEKEG
ncbi:type I DNA topoisomerase [Aliifodinibius sp. S!AR15-10]|uniref:type I DNA topoisomerase n=1 Tax=Aliifodinibius sp. S!AR15-10 TaxID=2950437 RepID=UPI002863A2B5|nr:type I DNA topoisomerase [Aliifodinibius sp. S!AR15-10]MDR8393718.1 type I DNA topoisomerase [Aliifodinibius sp. S!AR15-10]